MNDPPNPPPFLWEKLEKTLRFLRKEGVHSIGFLRGGIGLYCLGQRKAEGGGGRGRKGLVIYHFCQSWWRREVGQGGFHIN